MLYMIHALQTAYSRGRDFVKRHNEVNIWIEEELSNRWNKKHIDSLRSLSHIDESHKCVCELKRTDPFISVFLHLG